MRRFSIIISLLFVCSMCIVNAQNKSFTVVIDAGHGGKDPGALGKSKNEKDLNLGVALELGKLIEDKNKDINVVYTRKTDVFLPLQDRADIVNKNKADLFICIHTNSAEAKSVAGAEVFTLGLHKAESNLDVAMRENSVMLLEEGYQTRYQGFNPNSVESYIMFEFMQDQYLDKSVNYASKAQKELGNTAGRTDRGVRQAGFWVLHKSSCPSVLVEMGFITNPAEYAFLASAEGQKKIALALYNALMDYKREIDKKSGQPQVEQSKENASKEETKQEVKQEKKQEAKQEEKPEKKQEAKQEAKQELAKDSSGKTEINKQNNQQDNQPQPQADNGKPQDSKVDKELPVYKVQCFAVRSAVKPDDPTFKGLTDYDFYQEDGWYKYTSGSSNSYQEIAELQQALRPKFNTCFIVAFYKGKKIAVDEAQKISNK